VLESSPLRELLPAGGCAADEAGLGALELLGLPPRGAAVAEAAAESGSDDDSGDDDELDEDVESDEDEHEERSEGKAGPPIPPVPPRQEPASRPEEPPGQEEQAPKDEEEEEPMTEEETAAALAAWGERFFGAGSSTPLLCTPVSAVAPAEFFLPRFEELSTTRRADANPFAVRCRCPCSRNCLCDCCT